jgi:threonine/homoserine/homoserine lactone efflux protein
MPMPGTELSILLLLAACGAVGGFLSSTPLGVINLWVVNSAIDDGEKALKWFVVGVIAADVSYAGVAAWGYHQFLQEGNLGRWLELMGGAFLVILGVANLRKVAASNGKKVEDKPPTGKTPFKDFTLGAFMCGSNPAFLMFWVYAIKKVEEHFHVTLTDQSIIAFLGGIGLGDALWFKLITSVVRRGRAKVNTRALRFVSSGIAVAFVSFGLFALAKGFSIGPAAP